MHPESGSWIPNGKAGEALLGAAVAEGVQRSAGSKQASKQTQQMSHCLVTFTEFNRLHPTRCRKPAAASFGHAHDTMGVPVEGGQQSQCPMLTRGLRGQPHPRPLSNDSQPLHAYPRAPLHHHSHHVGQRGCSRETSVSVSDPTTGHRMWNTLLHLPRVSSINLLQNTHKHVHMTVIYHTSAWIQSQQ